MSNFNNTLYKSEMTNLYLYVFFNYYNAIFYFTCNMI